MTDVKYKLTYFNSKGLGEGIRYMFSYAGVPFEDVRVNKADWPALKPKIPDGALPVLEVNGRTLTQSACISRYLGKQFGLIAQDPLIDASLEIIVDDIKDAVNKMITNMGKNTPEAKQETTNCLKTLANKLEPLTEQGYFYGDKPTWVDFYFVGLMGAIIDMTQFTLNDHPKLQALSKKIINHPNVEKYLKQLPQLEPDK